MSRTKIFLALISTALWVSACSTSVPTLPLPVNEAQPAATSPAEALTKSIPPTEQPAPAAETAPAVPDTADEQPLAEDPAAPNAITSSGTLSQAEIDGLLFMREEEKLARDVYQALYAVWGQSIFQNIAASEQTHMDSLLALLERYGLADPANAQPGVFTNPDLQSLYNQLVAQGSASLVDALQVGAAIEEIDILDLQSRSAQTAFADIQQVYASLEKGSENHLRSFVRVLENQTGVAYQPQYLSPEAYAAIISGSMGNGAGGAGGRGNGGGGGNQP